MLNRLCPVGVSQICWIAPLPLISPASVNVCPGSIFTEGEILPPAPKVASERASPVPDVAMPPLPFSPVRFSGLIEARHRVAELVKRVDPADESRHPWRRRYRSRLAHANSGVSLDEAGGSAPSATIDASGPDFRSDGVHLPQIRPRFVAVGSDTTFSNSPQPPGKPSYGP
jgi:hypothetical protein